MALKDPLNTDERDWNAPEHAEQKHHVCRSCGQLILGPVSFFNGWPRDAACHREIVELSMEPQDLRELEGQEQAARQDIERDDFNRVRR